jgi:hypothetical protein
MALGRRPYSDTIKKIRGSVQNSCASDSKPWHWMSPEVIVKKFKTYCISDEMEDKESTGNAGE